MALSLHSGSRGLKPLYVRRGEAPHTLLEVVGEAEGRVSCISRSRILEGNYRRLSNLRFVILQEYGFSSNRLGRP